jgi:hypothetical protein
MTKKEILEKLKKDINTFFKVSIEKGTKTNSEVYARLMYYKMYKIIDPTITSSKLGATVGKDHSTVLFALKKIDVMYEYDKKFRHLHDSFIRDYPEYLEQIYMKKVHADLVKCLMDITNFASSLDIVNRITMIEELKKLKDQFIKNNNIENERVL